MNPYRAAERRSYDIPLPSGCTITLGPRTLVMGIVNVTPDSFAGGVPDVDKAVALAMSMEAAGADIIDIGGESTRPGAEAVPEAQELARVMPVVERLRGRLRIPLSIDTYKAGVAETAIASGACIVNDISGLGYDQSLGGVVARTGAGLVLMHTRGRSQQMYGEAVYGDVVGDVVAELGQSIDRAVASGVDRGRLIIDPGLGFAKRPDHTYALLAELPRLAALDRPLMVGPSRKSFLTEALGAMPAVDRDWGTAAAVSTAVWLGAHVVRVHNVEAIVQVVRVTDAIRQREAR